MEMWLGRGTDPFGYMNPTPVQWKVHAESACSGRHCAIHNPSDHHMKGWELIYRSDRGLMERICSHGVGHPDPDDLAFQLSIGRSWAAVHGCDGCCRSPKEDIDSVD